MWRNPPIVVDNRDVLHSETIQDQMEEPSNDVAKRPRVHRERLGDQEEIIGTTNTDIQGGTTMASDDGSAVQGQVHDNYHRVDPRHLLADANSTPNPRKSGSTR